MPLRLAGWIIAVSTAQPVHGQAAQAEAARPEEAARAAGKVPVPPRIALGITETAFALGVRQELLYDSNVAHGPTEAATLRGLDKGEFIATPGVSVNYGHSGERAGLAVSGTLGYDFHERNRVLNRERIDVTGRAGILVGARCSATGKVSYLRKQTRQQDLTTIVVDNTVKLHIANLAGTCVTPDGFVGNVQLIESGWHNSSRLNINNDRKAVSALFGHDVAGQGEVGATFLYERTDFFGRPAVLVMTPDTLEKTGIGLQISRSATHRLSWTASVGYVWSVARVGPGSRLAGPRRRREPVAQLELAYAPSGGLRVTALAARRVRHDTSFTITTDLQAGVDFALTPRLRAATGARWLRDVYYGRDTSLPQVYQDRQDQTTLYGTLTRRLGEGAFAALDIRHDKGRASFALFDYSGTRVTLTLAASLAGLFRTR